jgi:hypothetical protein
MHSIQLWPEPLACFRRTGGREGKWVEEIEIAIRSIMYQFLRILNKFSIIYAAKIG